MAIEKLSARKVDSLKQPGKYMDGGGLHLEVTKTGNRKWKFRYTLKGKRREMGLGTLPAVSLLEARAKRLENSKLVKSGIDPLKQNADTATPTFTACAARYILSQRRGWKNRKHARQWVSTLKTYARPVIGSTPVTDITTDDIQNILTPIWYEKTETAKRVQTRIENILDYAAAMKYRDPVNPARWRGHLDKLLPKPTKVKKPKHHPAMDYNDVAGFMEKLRPREGNASRALQLLILTATRTSEVLGARWDEIEDNVWTIPAERMKADVAHEVPLSPAAIELISALPRIKSNPYLFAGASEGKPLSTMALLTLMRKMGYGKEGKHYHCVPHGFRSSFRDWSGEVSSYPRDVCEMALAHAIENKVEAAYRRGSLFAKRSAMMNEWAEFISEGKSTSTHIRVA